MIRYFFIRILSALPTLVGVSIICFTLIQLTPGGPVEATIAQWKGHSGGESGSGKRVEVTEEQRQMLEKYYGFDKPVYERYFIWIFKVMKFDFGESYFYSKPVLEIIKEGLPISILMGFVSLIVSYLLCIPLGILKAVKKDSLFDRATSIFIFFLYSIPSFALGILLIVLFGGGSFWNFFPIEGAVSDGFSSFTFTQKVADAFHHLFLPLICYTIGSFASLTLLTKNSMLEQLQSDYITTARAKGCSEWRVNIQHAFRNALIPVASALGQWMTVFFTGSLLIESVFNLRGLGRLSFESILQRDYPIVLAIILLLSVAHIVGNLVSDLLYVLLDPRIDYT